MLFLSACDLWRAICNPCLSTSPALLISVLQSPEHEALCLGHLDAKAAQAPSCQGARLSFNLPISKAQNLH